MAPAGEWVNPRFDRVLHDARAFGREAAGEFVVRVFMQRSLAPLLLAGTAIAHHRSDGVVPIGEQVGAYRHSFAHSTFRREAAAIDLGRDCVDDDAWRYQHRLG